MADRKSLPPLEVHPYEAGVSLIVIAVTGMVPNSKGTFHVPGADPANKWETRSVLVVKESETEWSTYHGVSLTADDRTWTDAVAMARYIQETVL